MADNLNTRAIVYDMLMSIEKENTPSHILLSQTLMKYQYLDKRDRAFISRLFRGTLEYFSGWRDPSVFQCPVE